MQKTFIQKLILCGLALGLLSFSVFVGILLEQIFRGRYGDSIDPVDGNKGERFRLIAMFGLFQEFFNMLIARGSALIFMKTNLN